MTTSFEWTKSPSVCRNGKFFHVARFGGNTYAISQTFRGPWRVTGSDGLVWYPFLTLNDAKLAIENLLTAKGATR